MINRKSFFNRLSLAARVVFVLESGALVFPSSAHADTSSWQHQIVSLVMTNQSYPRIAQARKEEGVAKVRMFLEASGAVTKVELVASSGSDILDKETEKLFQKLGQLPPPPPGVTTLVVPVSWKLN